jgi:Peptidase family M28/PA domain
MMRFLGILAISPVFPFAFAQTSDPENFAPIRADRILQHIRTLASDDFEGRGPGSDGETKTIQYLVQQFRSFGLQPGNPDGTYLQRVPISILRPQGEASFRTKSGVVLAVPREAILVYSYRASPVVNLTHTEVMFAGYGVSAPGAVWDDYGTTDIRGKTVLILANDPRAEEINPAAAMPPIPPLYRHYHTNRLVKVQEAARRGAAAVILVRPKNEGDPIWQGFVNGQRELALAMGSGRLHPPVEGVIRAAALDDLLTGTDYNDAKLAAAAARPGFRAFPLPITADFAVRNLERRLESHNVVARLAGSDRALQKQYVIYTAHWDALGRDPSRSGDQIFNGALDDAGGTAQLLEIARSFASARVGPRRSILFLATTAEEKGLIGSRYYVDHPLYPLGNTVAVINLDGVQAFGSPADMVSLGGQSSLDAELERIVRLNGRVFAVRDSALYYYSDQAPFAVAGVPAIFPASGQLPVEGNKTIRERFTRSLERIHQPSDEVQDDWDLTGAAQDALMWLQLGYSVAQSNTKPEWNSDSIWRTIRKR